MTAVSPRSSVTLSPPEKVADEVAWLAGRWGEVWDQEEAMPWWQWVEQHVELGPGAAIRGPVSFDAIPMQRFFLDCLQDPGVRSLMMQVNAQGGKSQAARFGLLCLLKLRPADAIWYLDTDKKAKSMWKTRIKRDLLSCALTEPLVPKSRDLATNTLVQLGVMNLHILGAESPGNRESMDVEVVFCDELRNYKPGAYEQIQQRIKTFANGKLVGFSVAGDEGCCLDREFKAGSMHLPFWPCPKCGHEQVFRFGRGRNTMFPEERKCGGFVWETNKLTKPREHVYNFEELGKTVRYECENPSCRHLFADADKFELIRNIEMRQTNREAAPENRSMWWWEAYMPWRSCAWPLIVQKFLKADVARKVKHDYGPLRVFCCETEGISWAMPSGRKVEQGEIVKLCGRYSSGEWRPYNERSEESFRTMVNDFQEGTGEDNQHVYYTIRQTIISYSDGNQVVGVRSSLIEAGTLPVNMDTGDVRMIREKQLAMGIEDNLVWIDCAHKPDEVKAACSQYGAWEVFQGEDTWVGWTPFRGGRDAMFKDAHEGALKHWRVQTEQTGSELIQVYTISKSHYRHRLFHIAIRTGLEALARGEPHWWEIPKDAPDDYIAQMGNVESRSDFDAQGKFVGYVWAEHGRHDFPDCEQAHEAIRDAAGWG